MTKNERRNYYEMQNVIYEELKKCFLDNDKCQVNIICEIDTDIFEIKTKNENAEKVAKAIYNHFYALPDRLCRYENVIFDCLKAKKLQHIYSDFLLTYKKRDFDERKETPLFRQSKEKSFRFLLNEYIIKFKPKKVNEQKNLYFDITPQGEFIAVKKIDDRLENYDLSASERTLFNFLCFIAINKFRQFVNGVKDFNYREKPLILINFPYFLDESFDYISFLRQQKLNRKIIIVRDS